MRRNEIRALVAAHLGQLGYAPEHFSWPKPGRLHLLIDDALQEYRLPAPMAKFRLRDFLRQIPRRGRAYARPRRRVSADWQQPDFSMMWAA